MKTKYDPNDIKQAFEKADFYITQNENYFIYFDERSAVTKMSEHEIQIIRDFVVLQNDYVQKVHDNPNEKPIFDEKLDQKFSKLKEQIKEGKTNTIKNTDTLSLWLLPEAFAWSDVCGGSPNNPHIEYVKKTVYTQSSKSNAIIIVESWGYHTVEFYASIPSEWLNPNSLDYAKKITAYNCNFGAFRDQIVLENQDGQWDFRQQIKEPNPEFLDYDSPVWWWTYYVAVWHNSNANPTAQW